MPSTIPPRDHQRLDVEAMIEPPETSLTAPNRRTFLGYVLAGTTLVVGADFAFGAESAEAAVPSAPQIYDLEDLQTQSALPTSTLISRCSARLS